MYVHYNANNNTYSNNVYYEAVILLLILLFQAGGKFLFDSLIPGPRYEVRLMTSIIRKYE